MKKFLVVLVAALVIAAALWMALRVQQANRQMKVAELLPKTTLAFARLPDLQNTLKQWHASDLYALWHEPAVQAWLQKPMASFATHRVDEQSFQDFLQLEPTNTFIALTSLEANEPKFIGGFHFEKSEADARHFIDAREAPMLAKSGSAKREKIEYQDHQIETVNAGRFVVATVYDRNWFFASNDLATLKELLDRADRRTKNAGGGSLQESEIFRGATKPLSDDYAGMFYLDPKPFLEKLRPVLAMAGQTGANNSMQQLQTIQGVSGALGFDHGKMHETLFVAMPRLHDGEKIARISLPTASKDTFLYCASLASWPPTWNLSSTAPQPTMPAFLQQIPAALAKAGLKQEDLAATFGPEINLLGAWPSDAHWPSLEATLQVKDAAWARKILDAVTAGELFGMSWTRDEKDGVSYYSSSGFGGFVPIHPALALSGKLLVAASDPATAATLIASKAPTDGGLEKSPRFQQAEALLPAGDAGFSYIDSRLLYECADAAVRPLLLMSATIYPALGNKIDASKLPPTDAIAKHLSPIVMTQRYTDGGYLSESIGPVTFNEAALGLIAGGGALYYQAMQGFGALVHPGAPAAVPTVTPTPTPSPF